MTKEEFFSEYKKFYKHPLVYCLLHRKKAEELVFVASNLKACYDAELEKKNTYCLLCKHCVPFIQPDEKDLDKITHGCDYAGEQLRYFELVNAGNCPEYIRKEIEK